MRYRWTLWLVLILCAVGVRAEDMDIEVSFCQFQLPDVILNGYVSFNLIYKFDVDPDWKPVHITRVLDHFDVGKDQVRDCLRTWRLPDWRGAKDCWVHFVWQHARGWVRAIINGPGVRLKLKVVGEPPYLKRLIRDDEKTGAPRPPGQERDEGHSDDAGLGPRPWPPIPPESARRDGGILPGLGRAGVSLATRHGAVGRSSMKADPAAG